MAQALQIIGVLRVEGGEVGISTNAEEAMTDQPTAEEIATDKIMALIKHVNASKLLPLPSSRKIRKFVRAAVEAERERCKAEWKQERDDLLEEIKQARMYGGTYQE